MTQGNQTTELLPLTAAFLIAVEQETQRARAKFPLNRHKLAAFTEEVGEVANAFLENHYGNKSADDVWKECVQAAAMALRCAVEGDHSFDYKPPAHIAPSPERAEPVSVDIDALSFACETAVFDAMTRRAAPPAFMTLATEAVKAFFANDQQLRAALSQQPTHSVPLSVDINNLRPENAAKLRKYDSFMDEATTLDWFNGLISDLQASEKIGRDDYPKIKAVRAAISGPKDESKLYKALLNFVFLEDGMDPCTKPEVVLDGRAALAEHEAEVGL